MRKHFFALSASLLMLTSLMAQTISEATLKIDDKIYAANSISLPQDKSDVQSHLKQWFKQNGFSTTSKYGCIAVIAQIHPDLATATIDVYAKAEKAPNGEGSIVTLTGITDENTADAAWIRKTLNDFYKYVATNEMPNSEKKLKKAQKALVSAQDDVASINKSIASKQSKTEDKQKDIEKLKQKIADKQAEIEKLQEKIASTEKDISDIKADIQKQNGKKDEAQKKVSTAEATVQAAEAELRKFQQVLAQ